MRIRFDGNVLKSVGSRVLVVQRYNSTSSQWERIENSSSSTQGNFTYALGQTSRFSHYAAFLAQPTPFPAGKDKSTPAIGNLLWNRLKYAEKVLIIVLPILAALVCAASCLYFFRKEVSKKPNLDLSFREAHSTGVTSPRSPRSLYDRLEAAGEEGLLEDIRSIVRKEVMEGLEVERQERSLEVERQERSLISQVSNTSNVSNVSNALRDTVLLSRSPSPTRGSGGAEAIVSHGAAHLSSPLVTPLRLAQLEQQVLLLKLYLHTHTLYLSLCLTHTYTHTGPTGTATHFETHELAARYLAGEPPHYKLHAGRFGCGCGPAGKGRRGGSELYATTGFI